MMKFRRRSIEAIANNMKKKNYEGTREETRETCEKKIWIWKT